MTKKPLRWWAAWILALAALVMLAATLLIVAMTPQQNEGLSNWLLTALNMGAPLLGLIIALHQPRNRYGWLWLVYGLALAISALAEAVFFQSGSKATGYPSLIAALFWAYAPAGQLRLVGLILIILWFPTGRPPTPRWRFVEWWVLIAYLLSMPYWFVIGPIQGGNVPVTAENPLGFIPLGAGVWVPSLIGFLSLVATGLLAVLSMIARFRQGSRIERQQIKWFLLGGAGIASFYIGGLFGFAQGFWWVLYNIFVTLLIYLSIGLAILRYRLYDIDILIRRTLVYSILTALLALIYFGGVIVLQQFTRSITGASSDVAIVVSTLLIAALFFPLRRRVQSTIDRRFYRRKYDAAKTLAAFGAMVRDEVELDELTSALLTVVNETMQPASVSLWLTPTTGNRPQSTDR